MADVYLGGPPRSDLYPASITLRTVALLGAAPTAADVALQAANPGLQFTASDQTVDVGTPRLFYTVSTDGLHFVAG